MFETQNYLQYLSTVDNEIWNIIDTLQMSFFVIIILVREELKFTFVSLDDSNEDTDQDEDDNEDDVNGGKQKCLIKMTKGQRKVLNHSRCFKV